ncbi:unnamed protein product [Soboliphyme baturini]|uniref:PDE4_UCR domain-containing protein n=1 Tax=Soboliphyme baturini TaxID=241478 RepID=A0A183IKT7_9BILA|nr:unnamed protein product [Soboliphyme baturini]
MKWLLTPVVLSGSCSHEQDDGHQDIIETDGNRNENSAFANSSGLVTDSGTNRQNVDCSVSPRFDPRRDSGVDSYVVSAKSILGKLMQLSKSSSTPCHILLVRLLLFSASDCMMRR